MRVCLPRGQSAYVAGRPPADRRALRAVRFRPGCGRRRGPGRPARSWPPPRPRPRSRRVMPIDSSASPRRSPSSRSAANQRPGVLAVRAARPSGPRRRGRGPAARRRARRTAPGAHPPFCGSSGEVHLDEHRAPGRVAGDRGAELGRSTDCQQRDPRRERRTLLRCSCPRKCHAAPAPVELAALASSSWARFSPRSTTPAATTCCDARRRRRSWSRPTSVHRRRVAPGAAPRPPRDPVAHLGDRVARRVAVTGRAPRRRPGDR